MDSSHLPYMYQLGQPEGGCYLTAGTRILEWTCGLIVEAGCQLGLHLGLSVGAPAHVLVMWLLGFLTVCLLGSQMSIPRR